MRDYLKLLTEEILKKNGIESMSIIAEGSMSPSLIYKTIAGDEVSIRGEDKIVNYLSFLISEDRDKKINKIIK